METVFAGGGGEARPEGACSKGPSHQPPTHTTMAIAKDRRAPDIYQIVFLRRCWRMVVTANNPKIINVHVAGSGAAIGGVGVIGVVGGVPEVTG